MELRDKLGKIIAWKAIPVQRQRESEANSDYFQLIKYQSTVAGSLKLFLLKDFYPSETD